ncbi:MAG: hypothetical protein PHV61_03525 [Limnochordia bacterium]|nr:hypothetical protein [Limnochordia bacterium]MDD2629221.1 hypothetical protein [Limnochordia bacterium]
MAKVSKMVLVILLILVLQFTAYAVSSSEGVIGPTGTKGLTYTVQSITTKQVLPNRGFNHGSVSDQLSVIATPGEYESASFIVTAVQDIESFFPRVNDLVSEDGKRLIPKESIDIKYVKAWYQAGTAWWGRDQDKSKRILVPELLLNDPNLVKVDLEKQENYLKLSFPDREEYTWISDPRDRGGRLQFLVEEFPVQDSSVLLPMDIPAGWNQQLWVTARVPEEAASGVYHGQIELYENGQIVGSMQLSVTVLPFTLSEPYYTSSIYYRGTLDILGKGSISSEKKSREQFIAELEDMMAHGVTNPIVYQPLSSLEEVLKIRDQVGMGGQPLYYLGVRTYSPESQIAQTLDLAEKYDIPEVYFYAIDEASGDELTAQRKDWMRVHELGGKVFAAGWRAGNFELMGDIQDLHIRHDRLRLEEAANWHSVGGKIWSYGNPQTPAEDPELYRRNYGLMLWRYNYDGAATYAYQDGFGNVWNDFDHPTYRDHNFTYPTVNGVVGTIAWEGYREAVDDVRYLTTLLNNIEEAKNSENPKLLKVADQAEKYLANMNVAGDLDTIRADMIYYILQLQQSDFAFAAPSLELDEEKGISFDPNLESVIRDLIKKPSGPIVPADVATITTIDARDKGIKSLEGLEYCASLSVLRLDRNDVSDLSPLAQISELREIILDENPRVVDISPLANHPKLFRLRIHHTSVTDFRALDGHTALENIEYHGAKITDLSTLPNLPSLREFHAGWSNLESIAGIERFPRLWQVIVGNSRVTDLEPLLKLPALRTIWLDVTQQESAVAETLKAKGVTIKTL